MLRLIHVPNKLLPLKSVFKESQQEFGFIPAPSFLPSIYSCVWLTQCFLLPCKVPHNFFLALCISSSLLALLMHLISLKICGLLCSLHTEIHIPSTRSENLTLNGSSITEGWTDILLLFQQTIQCHFSWSACAFSTSPEIARFIYI